MSDSKINQIIQYGTTAERVAYTPDPPAGVQTLYLWYDTDNAPDLYVWDGDSWEQVNAPVSIPIYKTITLVIDGAGSVPTAGIKGYVRFPWAGTITKFTLLADQAGDAVVDIWKDSYANYPPTDADSITAAAPPTLTGADKAEDSTLTGWTDSIDAGDVLGFNLDSIATITRLTLILEVTLD